VKIAEMNWMQVEDHLKRDDRCVVPLGSTEQHAQLSASVDSILAERVATEAAAPLGIPVFPVLAYGITPYFRAYPATLSLRTETYLRLVEDLLDGVAEAGFRRILLCNGHGGNGPAGGYAIEWMAKHPGVVVRWHDWWRGPKTWETVQEIDPAASHASWMENFPWTRLANIAAPERAKPMIDFDRLRLLDPRGVREYLGDGNFGGPYQRPDADTDRVWSVAVAEARALLEGPWA
jgi:creatinine amidohydrolase